MYPRRSARARQRHAARARLFPLVAGVLLATLALADPPPGARSTDHISVDPHEDVLELSWSDAEERLRGSLRPTTPRAGEPLHVSLDVGSFEGAPFTGPLVLTLREAGATHGESVTVKRGERHWEATFVPENAGSYLLDVTFRTTHTKVLHATFEVGPSLVPRLWGYGLLAALALVLLVFVGRNTLRGEPKPAPVPSEPAASAPPEPAASAPPPPEPSANAPPEAPASTPEPPAGGSSEPPAGGTPTL